MEVLRVEECVTPRGDDVLLCRGFVRAAARAAPRRDRRADVVF
jgi:hypothetical protein